MVLFQVEDNNSINKNKPTQQNNIDSRTFLRLFLWIIKYLSFPLSVCFFKYYSITHIFHRLHNYINCSGYFSCIVISSDCEILLNLQLIPTGQS